MKTGLIESLAIRNNTKIIFLILDGVGGVPMGERGTELQAAHTPNLDALAKQSVCGVMDPVLPGVTPGSGPGHFGLFGYDPIEFNIGRGVLSAAGVGFKLTDRDLAARINFATVDAEGRVTDRRAGRIDDETNERCCEKVRSRLQFPQGVEIFLQTEKDHRAVVVFRGDGLNDSLSDTDPQGTGVPPLEVEALEPGAEATAAIVRDFVTQVGTILADEERANMILLRGFAKYKAYRGLEERFGLRSLAIASYPMYQGISRILGMDVFSGAHGTVEEFEACADQYGDYDFFFIHVKKTDSRGEDGDFDGKVKVIEEVDRHLSILTDLAPDVLVVTADHSTPSVLKAHSWHPVPVLLHSEFCRRDKTTVFDEIECAGGGLGRFRSMDLMGLALGYAQRLAKYGA